MHLLKQNTAATVVVGPVLDSTGAAVTTAVVGDFRLAKEGTSAVLSGATVTHDANGYYLIALTTTNTNTVGRLAIYSNNTAQSMGTTRFMVLLASVYDALVTNATNTTGGLPAATGAISALAGAVSTLTASGVRTELATELGRIDATVSSRLATASYTAPDNATIGTISINLGTVNDNVLSRLAAAAYTAPLSGLETAAAVWNAALATYTTAGSFGARILRTDSASAGNGLKVTGAGHGAADIHELQPEVITSAAFAAGWLTAAGTAADYVTELQAALGTATNQTAILDRVSFALSALAGSCSDAQTAAETYVLSIGGNTYTVDYSGLDASGNRGTTTLTKA